MTQTDSCCSRQTDRHAVIYSHIGTPLCDPGIYRNICLVMRAKLKDVSEYVKVTEGWQLLSDVLSDLQVIS